MIALIAAIAKNNCIGKDGALPWHLPEDLKHFKELTEGNVVLMGRKTWESLPAKYKPLPNRTNIIITRQTDYTVPSGVLVYPSIDAALAAHPKNDIMVIGGGQIFREIIEKADTLYITHVDRDVQGDAFFPPIDPTLWRKTELEDHEGFSFVTYKRT